MNENFNAEAQRSQRNAEKTQKTNDRFARERTQRKAKKNMIIASRGEGIEPDYIKPLGMGVGLSCWVEIEGGGFDGRFF